MASDTGVPVVVGVLVGVVAIVGIGDGVAGGCGVEVGKGVDVAVGVGVGEGSADEEQAVRSIRDRNMAKAVMYVCIGISYNGDGSMSSREKNEPSNGPGVCPIGS